MPESALDPAIECCLRQSSEQIFALARDGIVVTDCTPRILAVNPSFTRITGYPEAEVKGENPSLLQSGRHEPEFYRRMWEQLGALGCWRGELWNRRKTGEEYPQLLTIQAIRDARGERVGYLGVFGDLSRELRERELEAAKLAAEDAARAKSLFLANMSHEIRTPLTAILGFAETMIDSRQTLAERAHAVDTIIRNGRHLLALLNDILEFSKIRADRIDLDIQPTPLPDLLADTIEMARAGALEKGLEFSAHFMPPLPLAIQTDPTRVRQILFNLLGNSIKFTDEGSIRLIVSYLQEGAQLQLTVQDTGRGIADERIGMLFQPFSQADPSGDGRLGGAGLGLAISRELARCLGGDVDVVSTLGVGSLFVATVATGELVPADLVWDVGAFRQSAGVSPVRTQRAPSLFGKVLVADDNPANQALIALYLRRCGLEVEIAENGQEAVEKAQQVDFDLVLMDMRMPVMGGLDATELLRLTGFERPIIALSANIDRSDVETALAAGCDAYLPKPIHLNAFYQMLLHYLPQAERPPQALTLGLTPGPSGGDPELERLRAAFLAELPERSARMRAALQSEDWEGLRSQAHQIKGVGSNFGLPELTRLAGALEFQLLRGDHDEVALLLDDIEQAWPHQSN